MLQHVVDELAAWEAQLGDLGAQNMFLESSNTVAAINVPVAFDRDDRTPTPL